jgi:large subunit ribosomal protein L23
MKTYTTLIRPIITEKSLKLVDEQNQYCFWVAGNTDKNVIKDAVESQFKVTVTKVRIVNIPGKRVFWGAKKIEGRKKAEKKAIVTLKSKDSIDLFKVK